MSQPSRTPLSREARNPVTTDLTGQIKPNVNFAPIARGHTYVYQGELEVESSTPKTVAVKHIIGQGKSRDAWARMDVRVRRETVVWMRLKHKNIVELLGTTADTRLPTGIVPQWIASEQENIDQPSGVMLDTESPFTSHGMVSRWMMKGNLGDFIKEGLELGHRLQIVSIVLPIVDSLLNVLQACDVAAGLAYLHSEDIIHGDLTSANVLIDDDGSARLTDFGLSTIIAEFEDTSFITSTIGGYLRFRALEIMPPLTGDYEGFKPVLTPACDVYSLGGVVLQILTGKLPYHNIINETMVALVLAQRQKPERPSGEGCEALTEVYWNFIVSCWSNSPEDRCSAEEALNKLIRLREETLAV
ncbi:hypothetical protein HWV62_30845 [Athelia sp. TMB]|nr:hypothetical protein HWV62_30845 [Athelia sp. TMB]